jgi:hypothetical protein
MAFYVNTTDVSGNTGFTYDGTDVDLHGALSVSGGATISGNATIQAAGKLYFGALGTEYISTNGTDDLRFHSSDTIVLDGDGKSMFRTPYLALETSAAAEKFRFDIEGTDGPYLGIGTNSPTHDIDLYNDGTIGFATSGALQMANSAGSHYLRFLRGNGSSIMSLRDNGNTYFDGANILFETSDPQYFQIKNYNNLQFGGAPGVSMTASGSSFYITSGEATPWPVGSVNDSLLTIKLGDDGITSGSVGIGTSKPEAQLHVSGAIGSGSSGYSNTWNDGDTQVWIGQPASGSGGEGPYFPLVVGSNNPGGSVTIPSYITAGPTVTRVNTHPGYADYGYGMNEGVCYSIRLAGMTGVVTSDGTASGTKGLGNFGGMVFHANSNWSGAARRWLVSNAWRNSGAGDAGLGFAAGDGSSTNDPTISGSTPSVMIRNDGGLSVGNLTSIGSGLITARSSSDPQFTASYDGTYYMTTAVSSAGSTTWTNQKSFRLTGEQTDGSLQIDLNKISLVRATDSGVSNVLQIGDDVTYDQFSIAEDGRGTTPTNGYVKLRVKKSDSATADGSGPGYTALSLSAVSGSYTSDLIVNSVHASEALRFDTNQKAHAFDISPTGAVSIGDTLTVTGVATLADTSTLASDAAPTADAQIANKKYVDDTAGGGGGTIGGSITDNQVAVGATTADSIEGSANLTWDGSILNVNGIITATAKAFNIAHPIYKDKKLIHGSLEGPEHGMYVRGTLEGNGPTHIELPDYWPKLVGSDYTVQLTSYNSSNVYIVEKYDNSFMVDCNLLDGQSYKFDYLVVGSRENFEVVQ